MIQGKRNQLANVTNRYETMIRRKAIVLSIEDDFEWNDPVLKQSLLDQYNMRSIQNVT